MLLIGIYFASQSNKAKCPDDYRSQAQAERAFDSWRDEYYKAAPNAPYEEFRMATIQMYLNLRCRAVLDRISIYEGQELSSVELLRRTTSEIKH